MVWCPVLVHLWMDIEWTGKPVCGAFEAAWFLAT